MPQSDDLLYFAVRTRETSHVPVNVEINGCIVPTPHPATIAIFIDSLSNPERPTRCSLFYAGIERQLTSFRENTENLRRVHPEVFEAAVRFVSHPRGIQDILSMTSSAYICDCPDDDDWWVHDTAGHYPTKPSEAGAQLFDSICAVIHRGLIDESIVGLTMPWPTIEKLVRQSDKSGKNTARAIWPSKYTDVFGENPQNIIQMLWNLLNLFPDAIHPLFLLHTLTKLSRSTVMAALANVPGWAVQLLEHANKTLDANHQLRGYRGKFDILLDLLEETTNEFSYGGSNLNLFHAWRRDNQEIDRDVVLFASRALCLDVFKDKQNEHTRRLVTIGSFFYETRESMNIIAGYTLIDNKWPPLSPRIDTSPTYNPFARYHDDPGQVKLEACKRIHLAVISNQCASPDCLASTDTLGRKLQACGGCHIVRYCSQGCQHAAWKHSDIPHKAVCRLYSTITKKLGIDWKRCTYPDQQDILKKTLSSMTEKEARDAIDHEKNFMTWRSLLRSSPSKTLDANEFRKFTHRMYSTMEMVEQQRARSAAGK
ncbi:hypothetical protein CYLTODRAFT_493533 [Cylindrobasidium torrendii FP15055 ss-10]|uniref:MYND-type domain-containing protein n=1 Tax=Cylindrobasidium torrendii FP15055 ss-10 TaxID=1314674 RepID=A0A0D7B307_9AGAR|nr:hypothetical protein CYLTODRAFT_493533 [Cylindrobasidium torrendii FP15055 ss-10]